MTQRLQLSPRVRRVIRALLLGVAVSVAVTALSRVGVLSVQRGRLRAFL